MKGVLTQSFCTQSSVAFNTEQGNASSRDLTCETVRWGRKRVHLVFQIIDIPNTCYDCELIF